MPQDKSQRPARASGLRVSGRQRAKAGAAAAAMKKAGVARGPSDQGPSASKAAQLTQASSAGSKAKA